MEYQSATASTSTPALPAATNAEGQTTPQTAPTDKGITFALLLSALRCTVQYVVLPFILPWLGLAATIPPWITLALSLVALASLVRNLRYLWRIKHARRWSYLGLAVVIGLGLLVFIGVDLRAMLSQG